VDPPELLAFGRQHYPEVEWHRPRFSMFAGIVRKNMPPTRMIRWCCREFKERGGHDELVMTGVRWAESSKRRSRRLFERCEYDRTKWFLNPIIDWSDKDVWEYIHKRNLPYCSLYDEGFTRLGCIGCPMQGEAGMRRDFARWPKFERAYLLAFKRMLAKMTPMQNKNEWRTPEDVMHWWLTGKQPDRETVQDHLWDQPAGCFDQAEAA
jgi:phosphoadenosine phosphosulfate reductase